MTDALSYQHRDCDAAIKADNLDGACPGCGGPEPGTEPVTVTVPGYPTVDDALTVTYHSQDERGRAQRLAAAMHGGDWDVLRDWEQEISARTARDWLSAAEHAGLVPSAADLVLAVDGLDVAAETKRDATEDCEQCEALAVAAWGAVVAPSCDTCKHRLATAAAYDLAAERLRAAQGATVGAGG